MTSVASGRPGADWRVAGPVVDQADEALVELDEVASLYTEHGLWDQLV